MPDQDLLTPLRQFHQYTQDLLALARAGDWQGFEQKAPEREALLPTINDSGFLVAVAKADRAGEMRELIAEVQALNDELTELAEQAKSDIADTLKDQQIKDKAVKAYQADSQ